MYEGGGHSIVTYFILLRKPKSVSIVNLNYSTNTYSKTMSILTKVEAMKRNDEITLLA